MKIKNVNKQIISKKRVSERGEVFTHEREVKAMLDLVKHETDRIDSRFLEPACGTGNFLEEILRRKLDIVQKKYKKNQIEFEKYAIVAISSIYGVDILEDNVIACRNRLYNIFNKPYSLIYKKRCKESCRDSIRYILSRNILWGDALTLKTPDKLANPIIFSEWAIAKGSMIKRRDFTMANLLASQPFEGLNLFSDQGNQASIPTPMADYPLIHFLAVSTGYATKL